MKNARFGGLLLFIVLVALIVLDPGLALAQDAREETRLQVAAPEDVPLGNMARIMALLEDVQGNPISTAIIVFTSPGSLGGAVAEMDLGDVLTDAAGIAVLDYQLRVEGQNRFIARFHGNSSYQPAEASVEVVAIGTAQLSPRTAGVRVPFLGSWTLVAVLLGVWSVYLIVMLLVSQIPEASERQT